MQAQRLLAALRAPAVLAGAPGSHAGGLVLGYHDVRPRAEQTVGFEVTPEELDRHLTLAAAGGFRFVRPAELIDALEAGRPLDGLVAVTFDDALAGLVEHGLPILRRHGVPAAVFPVVERPGQTPAWWPGANRTLQTAELRLLAEHGFEIGSHTLSHRSLVGLPPAALEDELRRSRSELAELLGVQVDLLAYPSGHHDAAVRAAAAAAGYRAAFTFVNGRVTTELDRYRLPRLTMGQHHGRFRYAFHLARGASAWPDTQWESIGPEGH